MSYLFVMIDKENYVISSYRVIAENKLKALNEFAQYISSDENLQFELKNTARLDILEEPIKL